MGYVIRMPQMGMSMEAGTIIEWYAAEGDEIEEDASIVLVESEKTTTEVEAREGGVLGRILVDEGTTVEPGDPIGILVDPDEDPTEYEQEIELPVGGEAASSETPDRARQSDPHGDAEQTTGGEEDTSQSEAQERPRATPGAKRLADREGVDLSLVEGTGPQGVITDEDVETYVSGDGEPMRATRTVVESSSLTETQRTIADRLGRSYREAVHVTLNRSFDAETLETAIAAAAKRDLSLSVTDLLVTATGVALEAHPKFNAIFEDDELRRIKEVNVGVAVDIERGLVTPVIPQVTEKSIEEISEVRRRLTDRAQSGEMTEGDLSGGTFTISNLGMFGIDDFDPIINPPHVATLGVGRIRDDGSMTVSLSFDHRVVNGADAARFLDTLVSVATDESTVETFFDSDVTLTQKRSEETRSVSVESASGLSGSYRVSDTEVSFDEPTEMGGTGLAPTPVEHLLGALGSCLTLSVRTMADRDGLEIGRLECDVEGYPTDGPLERIDIELTVTTNASDDDLDRVVTKAERACYVERAISDEVDLSVGWDRKPEGDC